MSVILTLLPRHNTHILGHLAVDVQHDYTLSLLEVLQPEPPVLQDVAYFPHEVFLHHNTHRRIHNLPKAKLCEYQ